MRVKIKPYTEYFGPYQLVEKLCFWAKPVEDQYGFTREPDWVHDLGERFANTGLGTWFASWSSRRTERKDEARATVHIDDYDVWNMDSTLALIIQPMLVKMKSDKHGAPLVDDADVPEHLRRTAAPAVGEYETDDNHFLRWDWVLSEMQFAFDSKTVNSDWADQFHTGRTDIQFVPLNDGSDLSEMVRGPNDTSKFDSEGHSAYQARISNGFRLFGKYYQDLWT